MYGVNHRKIRSILLRVAAQRIPPPQRAQFIVLNSITVFVGNLQPPLDSFISPVPSFPQLLLKPYWAYKVNIEVTGFGFKSIFFSLCEGAVFELKQGVKVAL